MIRVRDFGFMRWMDILALALLIVGGLFLGVGGFYGFEAVTAFLGKFGVFARIFYVLIGLSALYEVFELSAIPKRWNCTLLTHSSESATS